MRFDFTFHADDVSELSEMMTAVIASLPKNLFDGKSRGFKIDAMPTDYPVAQAWSMPPHTIESAAARDAVNDEASAEKTRRNRRTKAEMEAARLKEQLQASLGQTAPVGTTESIDLIVVDEPEEEEVEGDYSYEEPDEEEVASSSMSPAEAKLKALEVLRDCYALPGGAARVKALQTRYGVKKFVDVSDDQGLFLLADANRLFDGLQQAKAA